MTLTHTKQIAQWLNEQNGFANAKLSYEFNPVAKTLRMRIEQRISLSLAGEKQSVKIVSIEASEVDVISGQLLESERDLSLYQIHALTDSPGMIFDIWGKDEVSFKCAKIEIKQTKEEELVTKPILNKNFLEFKIHSNGKPDARYWLKRLQEKGFDAIYITYFGNEIPTDEITDYTGLSIRPKEKVDSLSLGIKFCKVVYTDALLEIIIEFQNSELKDFWQAFVKVLSEMEIIQVRSGNVVFMPQEWIRILQTDTF